MLNAKDPPLWLKKYQFVMFVFADQKKPTHNKINKTKLPLDTDQYIDDIYKR